MHIRIRTSVHVHSHVSYTHTDACGGTHTHTCVGKCAKSMDRHTCMTPHNTPRHSTPVCAWVCAFSPCAVLRSVSSGLRARVGPAVVRMGADVLNMCPRYTHTHVCSMMRWCAPHLAFYATILQEMFMDLGTHGKRRKAKGPQASSGTLGAEGRRLMVNGECTWELEENRARVFAALQCSLVVRGAFLCA